MSNLMPVLIVIGILIIGGFMAVFFMRPEREDESHVRVGKEWMTIAEYKKRFAPKSK